MLRHLNFGEYLKLNDCLIYSCEHITAIFTPTEYLEDDRESVDVDAVTLTKAEFVKGMVDILMGGNISRQYRLDLIREIRSWVECEWL